MGVTELKYNTHISGPKGGKGEQRAEKTMVKNILKVIENTSSHRDKKSVKSKAGYKTCVIFLLKNKPQVITHMTRKKQIKDQSSDLWIGKLWVTLICFSSFQIFYNNNTFILR